MWRALVGFLGRLVRAVSGWFGAGRSRRDEEDHSDGPPIYPLY